MQSPSRRIFSEFTGTIKALVSILSQWHPYYEWVSEFSLQWQRIGIEFKTSGSSEGAQAIMSRSVELDPACLGLQQDVAEASRVVEATHAVDLNDAVVLL